MLDQDARPKVAPLSESAPDARPGRHRGAWAALAVVMVVLVASVAFTVGRSTKKASTRVITTRPVTPATAADADIPTRNLDEARENQPNQPLAAATRDKLAADLTAARTVALKYPTVASARAAGMTQAGKFAPGAGAHFIVYGNVNREIRADGSVDVQFPGSYIYDGISPSSRLVGLMYISLAEDAPAGFPGPNDHWHRHSNLCIQYLPGSKIAVPFAPDRDVTRAQCDTIPHGQFMQKTVWMVHAWVVPGWESPKGVFSHANPDLKCADGTMHTDSIGFCKGT